MAESMIKKPFTVNYSTQNITLNVGSSSTVAKLQTYGNIRILNLNGILNIPAANTVYNVGSLPTGNAPTVSGNASFTPIVSGQVKGIGRFSALTSGQIQIISNFAGNQEIGATILWTVSES